MLAIELVEYVLRNGKAAVAAGDKAAFEGVMSYAKHQAALIDGEIKRLRQDVEALEGVRKEEKPKRRTRKKAESVDAVATEPVAPPDYSKPYKRTFPDIVDTPIEDFGASSEVKDLEGGSDD